MKREAIRCPSCNLVQFVTSKCRKCGTVFFPLKPAKVQPIPDRKIVLFKRGSTSVEHKINAELVGSRVKQFRTGRHLSQKGLAEIMGCVRTYISKIERALCLPDTPQILRLADALKIHPALLVASDRELAVDELMSDPFMALLKDESVGIGEHGRMMILNYAKELAKA